MVQNKESLNIVIKKGEPCDRCRKRDSCFINPHQDQCTGFEAGIPWSIQYAAMDRSREY